MSAFVITDVVPEFSSFFLDEPRFYIPFSLWITGVVRSFFLALNFRENRKQSVIQLVSHRTYQLFIVASFGWVGALSILIGSHLGLALTGVFLVHIFFAVLYFVLQKILSEKAATTILQDLIVFTIAIGVLSSAFYKYNILAQWIWDYSPFTGLFALAI